MYRSLARAAWALAALGALTGTPRAADCAACGSLAEPMANDCDPHWSLSADYLHWWIGGGPSPSLLTSSPLGTPRAQAGVLGQSATTSLFGGAAATDPDGSGVRLEATRRVSHIASVSGEFFWLGANDGVDASSTGDPGLMRPFFNTNPGDFGEDSELIAFDDPVLGDTVDGTASIDLDNNAYSAALNCRWDLTHDGRKRLTGLIGYRFFRFNEGLDVTTRSTVTATGGAVAQGTTFDVRDAFSASNEFHGFELGLLAEDGHGPWNIRVSGKLALGGNRRESTVGGETITTVPTIAPLADAGGLLAQSTNSGIQSDDRFALLPELRVDLRRQIGCHTELRVGYSLLYLTDALRTGDLIDRRVDGRFLDAGPPPAGLIDPAPRMGASTVWLQGVNVGLTRAF